MRTLKGRILGSLIGVAVISVTGISLVSYRILKSHQEEYLLSRLSVAVMMSHASLRNLMLSGHQSELRDFIAIFSQQTSGINLRILKPQGTISISRDSTESGQLYKHFEKFSKEPGLREMVVGDGRGKRTLVSISPVVRLPSCRECHPGPPGTMAYLAVELEGDQVKAGIWRTQGLILISSLTVAMVILLAAFGLHFRWVKGSLEKITEGISRIEQGDFSVRIDMDKKHELGVLGQRINRLADRLEEMRSQLEESHRQEMERAEKMASVGALAASIAHEIKNPISGIAGAIEVLKAEMDPNDERREIFEEILRQTERVNRAVSDLLTYARPSPPELVLGDINEPLRRALNLLDGRLKESHIQVVDHLEDGLPPVMIDPQKMTQVFVNLILNAIQAMPQGGRLELRTAVNQDEVVAEVKDTGVGIPPEIVGDIFKPFFTTKHQGTGLGLSICLSFVEAHGGRIEVDSFPHEGSTFRVVLKPQDEKSKPI